MHDVYAFGAIAPSMLVVLQDDHPPPGGYAEIAGVHPSIGGEAACGAYVLARLGVATKLDGNHLGEHESSEQVIDLLTHAGVDCRAIRRVGTTGGVREIVVSAAGERTVLGTYKQLQVERAWNMPSEEDIRSSRIVCLDPFFDDASVQAARWCVAGDTPYVTVDAAPDSEIARHAEVLIVSEEFATREFGSHDPHELLAAYTDRCDGVVVLTYGSEPIVYGRRAQRPRTSSPYTVDALDTTGAGDSFRAGIIYAMLHGADEERIIRTASAVAALVCERFPGVLNSPHDSDVSDFLVRHT